MSVDSELKKEKRMLMSRTLPTKDDLVGIWQRESITIDGAEPVEDSVVYWLHAGDFYADMRWPISSLDDSKKSAFAGAANWSAPYMSFSHELDYTDDIQEDVGHLSVFRGKLLEHGEVKISGQTIKFQETWRRVCQTAESTLSKSPRSSAIEGTNQVGGSSYAWRILL